MTAIEVYKEPVYLSESKELQKGDILLFRPCSAYSNTLAKVRSLGIKLRNSLSIMHYGHRDTMHAAICIGHTIMGRPAIAHVTGVEMRYRLELLDDMMERDGGDRSFLVFRPLHTGQSEEIAEIAAQDKNEQIQWSVPTAIQSFFTPAGLKEDRVREEKELDESSYCSKFVVQVIKKSERVANGIIKGLNIRSTSSPADLEGALYLNPDYEFLIYPGNGIYHRVKECIFGQLTRISKKKTDFSRQKMDSCIEVFREIETGDCELKDHEKTLLLLKKILPILNQSKKEWGFKTESYKTVLEFAEKNGIFKDDIDRFEQVAPE